MMDSMATTRTLQELVDHYRALKSHDAGRDAVNHARDMIRAAARLPLRELEERSVQIGHVTVTIRTRDLEGLHYLVDVEQFDELMLGLSGIWEHEGDATRSFLSVIMLLTK